MAYYKVLSTDQCGSEITATAPSDSTMPYSIRFNDITPLTAAEIDIILS